MAKATDTDLNADEIVPVREEFIEQPVSDATTETAAPRRRGRPPGSKNRTYAGKPVGTRGRSGSLENQIGGFLVTINAPLMLLLPRDALDAVEMQALAKALDEQCQTSPTFRRYVESALKVQGTTSLVGVVALIAGRRAIRHDIVPIPEEIGSQNMDAALGNIISMMGTGKPFNPQVVTPASLEATA